MPRYEVKVNVEYHYEVEADSAEEAEQAGWDYAEYYGEVDSIYVSELEDGEYV